MNRGSRLAALFLLLGCGALAVHLASAERAGRPGDGPADLPPAPVGERPLLLEDSASCKECHPGVYAEWEASHHRMAYTNPEVQRLSREFQDKDCLPCHLPRPVFETGLGVRVLERATRKSEGVDCFTCHRSGNACLGTGDPGPAASSAPCNPAQYAPVGSMRLCSPCHDQHKVHQDWMQSRFAVEGEGYRDCNDCHMPPVQRTGPDGRSRPGRSHLYPAAHDAAMLRSAATLEATAMRENALRLIVSNSGTGHNFPADERHRAADLEVTAGAGAHAGVTIRIDRFRNPYREEFGIKNKLRSPGAEAVWELQVTEGATARVEAKRVPARFNPRRKEYYPESTQIPAGESRAYVVTLPTGFERPHVRLWYRTNPYQSNDDAVLVAEKRLRLR